MANSKTDNEDAALLASLARTGKELAAQGRTSAKFPLIRRALAEACQGLPPDTRLPSIRELAAALGTTVVPVQRAVNELKQEGLVHAKHKSGLYSHEKAAVAAGGPDGMAGFKRRIRFLTDSALPEQRALWDGVAKNFMATQDYIALDINYRPLGENAPPPPPSDTFECVEWNYHNHFQDFTPLRLKDYLAETPEAAGTHFPSDGLATIYYQSAFLYFNSSALPQTPPKDFPGQLTLCRALQGGACIHPILLAGRLLGELVETLRRGAPPDGEGRRERFHDLAALATSLSFRDAHEPERSELFAAGVLPLLLGHSNLLRDFRRRGLPFKWGAVPALNVEGGLVKIPVATGVHGQTSSPMECVRWVRHLLSAPIQDKFADFGYFTEARPPDTRFASSPPLFAADYQEHYVGVYIVNAELWNCIKGKQSATDAWRNVVAYAKAYLSG